MLIEIRDFNAKNGLKSRISILRAELLTFKPKNALKVRISWQIPAEFPTFKLISALKVGNSFPIRSFCAIANSCLKCHLPCHIMLPNRKEIGKGARMIRHLASVRTIDAIEPIKDADRIEVAVLGGWKVVVSKGEFSPGDKCVYFELDSSLPTDDPRFAFLAERSVKNWLHVPEGHEDVAPIKVSGHVLRTAKLRGQISQGLVMSLASLGLDESLPVGTDVTEELGVMKYEPYCPGNTARVGSYPEKYAIKSDCERVQNLADAWEEISQHDWYATVKVDGASTSILKDGEGNLRWASRNQENAWVVGDRHVEAAIEWGLVDSLEPGMLIQFEYAGPGVQSNRLALDKNRPFVFCVWKDCKQLSREMWPQACLDAAVPVLEGIAFPATIEEAIAQADGLRGNVSRDKLDEGIVWHTAGGEGLDCLDGRDCFKAINNKYLLKSKD